MIYPKLRHLIQHIANAIGVVYVNMCHHQIVDMAMKRICNDSLYLRGEHMTVHHHRETSTISFVCKAEDAVTIAGSGEKEFHIMIERFHKY